ncbi:MAG: ACP S-malonyltransferase [Bdellovibrionales bacterium]|nr:ACP S-malonyltransferase [Bdellovibrionales bacterium]
MTEIRKPFIALFPGQGSQAVGMGADFYRESSTAQELFEIADKTLGFSLSKICFEGPADQLTRTDIGQPAILTVSTIAHQLWSQANPELTPDCAAGHSLGEYSALVAAGALEFSDAVMLVHKRGQYMQEAVPIGEGKMVAVIGAEVDAIQTALDSIDGVIEIANDNSPGQVVVSGSSAAIDEFIASFAAKKLVPLEVSAPFHCSLMQPAAERLAKDLDNLKILPPAFPIISNVLATAISEPEEIRTSLKAQVCGSVRWVESMNYVTKNLNVQSALEFGHGNVLVGLMKRINKDVERISISSIEHVNS